MTVGSLTNRSDYTGNDSTGTYAYGFRIFDETDLVVTIRDSNDNETILVLTTDYTVTGVGDLEGGNIILIAGPAWMDGSNLATDFHLTIQRIVPLLQETDLRNQGSYLPEDVEDQLDRGIMIDQQAQDQIDRSLKLSSTVSPLDFDTNLPADIASNAGKAIVVNDTGDGFLLAENTTTIDTTRVLKSGDTMTGDLTMASQKGTKYGDADNSNFLKIKATTTVTADRNLTLPDPGADDSFAYLGATQTFANSFFTKFSTPKSSVSLTGSQDNYFLPATALLLVTSTGAVTFTGFANGADGRIVKVRNLGTNTITFSDNNISSSAANRFYIPLTSTAAKPSGLTLVLGIGDYAEWTYDSSTSNWTLSSTSGKTIGSFTANFNQGAGASGSSTSVTIRFSVKGNIIALLLPDMTGMTAGTTASNFGTSTSTLPAAFIPSVDISFPVFGRLNNVIQNTPFRFCVFADGSLAFFRVADASSNFTSTQTNNGPLPTRVTYEQN